MDQPACAERAGRCGCSVNHEPRCLKLVDTIRSANGIDVEVSHQAAPDHDELWRRIEARLDVSIVRDRRHVRWRYESCPSADYRFVWARRAGKLAAVATFRDTYLEPDCGALVDVLRDGEVHETLAAVVRSAHDLARTAGLHHLVTLLAPDAPELPVLLELGYRPIRSGFMLVARSFHDRIPLERIRGRWWHTLGDFDLA